MNLPYRTKNDMARVVVTALYNCEKLVGPTDVRVVWMVNKHTKSWLEHRYNLAVRILDNRGKETE